MGEEVKLLVQAIEHFPAKIINTSSTAAVIPNTQGPDNELVSENIANVIGLDNIHESLLSPNDFQNADVFSWKTISQSILNGNVYSP